MALVLIAAALAGCTSDSGSEHNHDDHAHAEDDQDDGPAGPDYQNGGADQGGNEPAQGPRPKLEGRPISEPAEGKPTVPSWKVGYSWSYGNGNGVVRNMTVDAIEEFDGAMAYRILVDETPKPSGPPGADTLWVDQATLGVVGFEMSGEKAPTGCSAGASFPMRDTEQTCETPTPYGTVMVNETRTIGGWFEIATPKGDIEVLQIDFDTQPGRLTSTWYSPEAQNRAAFEDGSHMFTLLDWTIE